MWSSLKNGGEILLYWIGVAGGIASIYAIRNDIIKKFSDISLVTTEQILKSPWVWMPSVIALPFVASLIFLRSNLKARGNISTRTLLLRLNPFRYARTIYELHWLYTQRGHK